MVRSPAAPQLTASALPCSPPSMATCTVPFARRSTVPCSWLFSPMKRATKEFSGRSYRLSGRMLLDLAVLQHRDPAGHGQRLGLVVGDVHHRDAQLLVQMLDLVLHALAQQAVQRAQRLVHQHQRRLEHQRPRQRHALLLPARQLHRAAVAERLHAHPLEGALHPGRDLALARAAHAQRERQVLPHRHVREQRVVLEHHADAQPVRRQVADGAAVQQDLAVGHGLEAGQHHQAGGLAGAGRPQHGQEFAALDGQVHALDRQRAAVVALLHALEAHHRVAGVTHERSWRRRANRPAAGRFSRESGSVRRRGRCSMPMTRV